LEKAVIPQQWYRSLFGRTPAARKRTPQRRPRQARLQAERLEDRLVPTLTGLASFTGANGSLPVANLAIDGSGNLYGATVFGGGSFNGTVFEVLKGSGTITTLASFNGTNGAHPYGGVVVDGSGNVYGTTRDGGASGNGTVFEIVAGSGVVTTMATFSGANGAGPTGSIARDGSGNIFGTTQFGGSADLGTVFEVSGGTISTLTSFTGTGTNGANPQSGVILDGSGNLVGTTLSGGGSANNGTIFSIPSTGGSINTLTSFTTVRGPYSGVIEDGSGNLFGTTSVGGGGFGTVYELQSGHSTILVLASFSNTNGANPTGSLVENGSGTLFGTTQNGGASGKGTVFEVPSTGGVLNTLANLTNASGANPQAGLAMDGSNNLFGVGANGGASGNGAVFEVQPFPSFATTSLSNWTVNQPGYNQTISTVGGTGTLSFSLTSGTLPTGITLSTSGVLSGTPSAQASYSFTVTVTDSLAASASQSYSVTINPPVVINTTTVAKGRVGSPYTQTISASGGTGTLTFSQTGGTLPAGVTLSTGGVLSGTPSAGGTYSFSITATDVTGASASHSYSVIMGTFLTLPSSGFSGQQGGTVLAFPININQLEDAASPTNHVGLASASFAISYPAGVFNFPVGGNLATANVHLGSIPLADTVAPGGAADWTVTANSPRDGVLDISLTVKPGVPSKAIATDIGGGSLVTVDFPVSPNYNPSTPTAQVISAMSLIDATHTSITGANGSYLLNPSPPYNGSITINSAPQFPPTVTSPQSYLTEANTPLSAPAPGLLTGASDPQGQTMTVNTVNGNPITLGTPITLSPSGATLTVNADGSFSYTPATNFVGTDSFTFTIQDVGGNVSSMATANVQVTPTLSLVPESTPSGPDGTVIREDVVMDNPNPTGGVGPLAGFNLAITYDPGAVSTSAGAVALGSTVPNSWNATVEAATPGVVAIGAFDTSGMHSITETSPIVLATVDFTITALANQFTPIKLVPSVASGSGTATTVLTGSGGTFTLNPALSGPLFVAGVDTSIQVTGESTTVTINPSTLPNGDQGVPYNQTLNATGGANGGPFSYSVTSGTLPPGLTFTTVNDPQFVLSGTPTTPGTYTFTVTASDAALESGSQSYTVVINPPVAISTTALAAWTVNQPGYNQTITATGGDGSYTFSQSAGTLPTGLTLSSSGVLSGTPTATGSYSFTVSVNDVIGSSTSKSFTVVINPAVAITTTALANWTVNTAGYSQTIAATGGTGTKTFATTSGTLPTGLTLDTGGVLSGTPTAIGTYSFAVTATDTTGASGSASYSVTINTAVVVTTTTLPTWTAGKAFSQTITATGGTGGSYKFTKTAGTLPTGLTLTTAGVLSGTPSAAGTFTFTITAMDTVGGTGSQPFTETINPAISITTVALVPWTINVPNYNQTVTATGGTGTLTFSITGGSLPTGLSLNGSSGVISGTPTVAVTSQAVTITATDTVGATGSNPYTITINPAVAITTTTLGNWTVNRPSYSQTVLSTGGTAPITFASTAGTLPTGLTLASNGVLSGTPTATGTFTFTVTASDSLSSSGTPSTTASKSYTVTINSPVTITTTTLTTPWTANLAGYSQTITATNGTPPYTFSKSAGTIPTGLALNSSTGVLSGKPTAAGTFTFTIAATDIAGSTGTQSYTVVIHPAVTITTTSLSPWTVNIAGYSQTISATGGMGSITFAATSGTLPTGLTLSSAGVLSGTPGAAGSFTFTVTATDSLGATGTKSYTVVINPAVSITTTTLAPWTVNSPSYSQTIAATGGTTPYSFAATAGTLPTGLTLSTGGVLSGTPTATGSFTFTVTATDSVGGAASKSLTVVINPVPSITTTALANGTIGVAYSQTISTTGGTGTPSFTTTAGTLPTGLTLSTGGVLSGTPTVLGTYSFTVTATDKTGSAASQNYSVTIFPAATQITLTAPSTAVAGTPFSVTISATDSMGNPAGAYSGTVTLSSSAGADISPTSVAVSNGTATVLVTLTSAGTQTITASASGLTSGTASVAVSHGALGSYLVTVVGFNSVPAGSPILATVQAADSFGNPITTGYSGPASVTASIGPGTTLSNFPQPVPINNTGFGVLAGVIDLVGFYTISVSDGTFSGSIASPVTITPGTPAKVAFAAQPQNTPTGDKLPPVTVNILDSFGNLVTSDNTDSVSISVASGPGSILAGSTTTATAASGVVTFNNLTLATLGTYTLRATDAALSSLATSASFSVTPIQVVTGSLATSPSGFSLSFNAPYLVNSVTPALYGTGFKSSATVTPTVTLTQTTGTPPPGFALPYQVQGSVIVDQTTHSLTFLATNVVSASSANGAQATPILADGTYVIRVTSSGANGLQAFNAGGGYLDGTNSGTPGHDYTSTFAVAAAGESVLWAPATADGPGQPLVAPGNNKAGSSYPIYLDSAGGVTSVQATINYNSNLLTVTPSSTATFTVTVPTAGTALISYNGPALAAGIQTAIGSITAAVPSGTAGSPVPYKAKDLLHLSSVTLNGSSSNVVTSDGLHVVAYVADADGNGAYSSADAVLLTRVLVQADTGFAAYPLIDPVIIADTDGGGFTPSDAALQANEAGVGLAAANLPTPPIPTGVTFTPIGNNVDPSLTLPDQLQVGTDGTVTVAVNLDDAAPAGSTGLAAGHLALTYDPRAFTVSAADVHLGSLLAGRDWSIVPTIDPTTGQIAIALSSATPITRAIGGSLVTIDFHEVSAAQSTTSIALVGSVNINGQTIQTLLEDAQGAFTLNPAPINGSVGLIASVVTLGTPAPVQAVTTTPAAEVTTGVLEVSSTDSRPAQAPVLGPTATPSVIATGEIEPEGAASPLAVETPAMHVSAVVAHATIVAAAASSATAAPLSGLVLPLVGTPTFIAQANSASSWQHVADQLFQALGRTTPTASDPALVGVVQTLERALAGQMLLSQSSSDNLDSLNWDDADLDWQPAAPEQRSESSPRPTAPSPAPVSDQAALDQVFSEDGDDADMIQDGE
jgi:uncharacterized repeat protein (TIGR03803 family)